MADVVYFEGLSETGFTVFDNRKRTPSTSRDLAVLNPYN